MVPRVFNQSQIEAFKTFYDPGWCLNVGLSFLIIDSVFLQICISQLLEMFEGERNLF